MNANRLKYSGLFALTFVVGACQPQPVEATAPPFKDFTLIGEGWKAERTGEKEFILYDVRGGLLDSSQRQEFLHSVLETLQNEKDCRIESEEVLTNGSKGVVFQNPECLGIPNNQ